MQHLRAEWQGRNTGARRARLGCRSRMEGEEEARQIGQPMEGTLGDCAPLVRVKRPLSPVRGKARKVVRR